MLPPQTFYTQVVHEKGQKLQIWTWAPYRVQCPCLKSQHQLSWILLTFATAIMGTLSKTVRFPLYPSQWVIGEREVESKEKEILRSPPFPEKPPSPISPCDKYSQETLLSLKIELPTSSIVNKSFQKLLKYLFVKVRY